MTDTYLRYEMKVKKAPTFCLFTTRKGDILEYFDLVVWE